MDNLHLFCDCWFRQAQYLFTGGQGGIMHRMDLRVTSAILLAKANVNINSKASKTSLLNPLIKRRNELPPPVEKNRAVLMASGTTRPNLARDYESHYCLMRVFRRTLNSDKNRWLQGLRPDQVHQNTWPVTQVEPIERMKFSRQR